MKIAQKSFIIFLSSMLVLNTFFIIPTKAIIPDSTDISPSSFSPDSNGLNDTTTVTVTYTASQSLYVNIFYNISDLIREDRLMTESPSGTYKYTWDGKNDSGSYVQDEGTYTIKVSDNPSSNGDTVGTVAVDLTAPTSPSLSVDGGATYATSTSVNLTIGATGASKMKVSNYANFTGATWDNYATSKAWALLSTDGSKTVYINFRDTAGTNVSTYDSITLDTTLSDPSLSINSGASSTNNRNVTLTISASDATYMKIDNDTNFLNMSSWISKSSTYNFTLPTGADGTKTVYLRVKDDAGNIKTTSDTISLDTTSPSNLSISIDSGASYTNSTNVSLTLSASGGPSRIYLSNDNNNWTGYDYTTSKYWTLSSGDATKIVYYKAADAAGNNATAVSATITLDTTAPSPVTLSSPSDAATVSTQTPTFSWADPNPSGTRMFTIQIKKSGNVVQTSNTNSSTTDYTASTLSSETYSWRVYIYDMANNSAVTSERSFTISISGLEIPSPTYPTASSYVNDTTPRLMWSQVTGSGTIYYDYKYGLSSGNLNNTGTTTSTYVDTTVTYSNGQQIYWSVRARNTSNTTSYSSVRSFYIDTQAPTGLSISIAGGDSYTSSTSVTLTLSASDSGTKYIMVSNSADFSGASWGSYTTSKSWTLSSGEGTKTVYFKVKDSAVSDQGSTSTYTSNPNIASAVTDTIILDATAPTVTAQSPSSGGTTTTTTNLPIRATLSDTGSGINTSAVTMIVDGSSVTPTTITSSLVRYVMPTASVGTHTVNVSATDCAGYTGYANWSFTVTSDDGGDTPGDTSGGTPTYSSSVTGSHQPETITNTDFVNITAVLSNFVTDISSVDVFWNDGTEQSKQMTSQTSTTYTATIGPFNEGITVPYYIIVLDSSARETTSTTYNFAIKDYGSPTITVISPEEDSKLTERKPTIKATYSDTGGIDTDSVDIKLNNKDITSNSTITATEVTYVPSDPLSYSQHTIVVSVADNSSNVGTKTWSFTVHAEEVEMTEIIEEISEGETETINFEDYGTSVGTIKITAATDLENVVINVTTIGEKPDDVTAPEDTIYMYLVIESNTEASDISSATINFKVEKIWIEGNNIDKAKVKLLRYDDGWLQLATTMLTEDDTYVYYEATTSGFSIFAIVGSETTLEGDEGLLWFAIIAAVIAALIITVVILFKTGHLYFYKQPLEKSKEKSEEKSNKKK